MKRCRQARRWQNAAFAGDLSLAEQLAWEQHLVQCQACRSEAQVQDRLAQELASFREPALSQVMAQVDVQRFVERVQRRLDLEAPLAIPPVRHFPWVWKSVAAGWLIALGGWYLQSQTHRPVQGEPVPKVTLGPRVSEPAASASATGAPSKGVATSELAQVEPELASGALASETFRQWPELSEAGRPFDEGRRDAAMTTLREVLGSMAIGDPGHYEASIRSLRRNGWPIASMLGRVATSEPAPLAEQAIRALGYEQESRARKELWNLRRDPEVGAFAAERWLLANPDPRAIATLYWEGEHQETVRRSFARVPVELLSEWSSALLDAAPAEKRNAALCVDLLELWSRDEPQGIAWLLQASLDQRLPLDAMVGPLQAVIGFEREVQVWLESARKPREVAFGLQLTQRVPRAAWLPWLKSQRHDPRNASAVVASLALQPGAEALRALQAQQHDPNVLESEWLAAWQSAVRSDGARVAAIARAVLRSDSETVLREWIDALLLAPSAEAARALAEIVEGPLAEEHLRLEVLAFVAQYGDSRSLEVLQRAFDRRANHPDTARAGLLVALGDLGGEPALRKALALEPEGALSRVEQNLVAAVLGEQGRSLRERCYLVQRRWQRLPPTRIPETME